MLYVVFPMSVKSHHKRLLRDPPDPVIKLKGNGQLSCSMMWAESPVSLWRFWQSQQLQLQGRILRCAWTIGSVISVMPGMRSTHSTLWIQALLSRRGALQTHMFLIISWLCLHMPPISDWKLVSGRFNSKMWCVKKWLLLWFRMFRTGGAWNSYTKCVKRTEIYRPERL